MKIKVETEKKYYCIEPGKLVTLAIELGFIEVKNENEIDEYFTDIDSEYIKNRTCLRIRKCDDKKMEITFKGKSNTVGQYCKLENNILCNLSEYNNFVNLFSSLGYYSYVVVEKERMVYEYRDNKYIFNIMIDKLSEIGGFVEFEIISEREGSSKKELKEELERFISKFDKLNLEEAIKPYRDIVAEHIYNKIFNNDVCNFIYINIDKDILEYEKDFFKKYKNEISELCGLNVEWEVYKKNIELDDKISFLVDEYLDNLVFDTKELFVMLELLKKIDYRVFFETKVNELFFTRLFLKLDMIIDDVLYLKEEKLEQVLERNYTNKSIVISDKYLKEINSILLILINNR